MNQLQIVTSDSGRHVGVVMPLDLASQLEQEKRLYEAYTKREEVVKSESDHERPDVSRGSY